MENLCNKVKSTKLFTDAQKVDILVALPSSSPEDQKKLEAGIDLFDSAYTQLIDRYTAQIQSVLGHIEKDASSEDVDTQIAIEEMKLGLDLLSTAT